MQLIVGIVEVLLGFWAAGYYGRSAVLLVAWVAAIAIMRGITDIVLAFRVLPLVLLVSALSALLFHWRILPVIVNAFALVLEKTMGLGGAVGVSAAANVFVGMAEGSWFGGTPGAYVAYPDTGSGEEVAVIRIVPRDEEE